MDKLRLRFEKTGRAVYISHLDLMHTMQRAFSRAGYALKYSEGFNPHPQISIALPLSVGVGSCCELMDFRLNGDAALAELPARLTAAMPEGIRVTDCYVPETKFAALKYLQIEGRFVYDDRPPAEMAAALQTFFCGGSEPIVITKKTKRGVGESDIRPAIRQLPDRSRSRPPRRWPARRGPGEGKWHPRFPAGFSDEGSLLHWAVLSGPESPQHCSHRPAPRFRSSLCFCCQPYPFPPYQSAFSARFTASTNS